MSRLTSNEVAGLMEAYTSVYEANELKNAEVLDEAPNLGTGGTAQDMINRREAAKARAGGTLGAGGGQAAIRKLQSQGVDARSAYAKVYSQGERNLSAAAKPAPTRPAAPAPAARPAAAAPAPRPAAPAAAARPAAAPVAAKPATPAPAAKTTPVATPAKPASTATTGFQLARQGVDLSKASPAPAPAPAAPKPQLSARAQALKAGGPQGGPRQLTGGGARALNQDLDLFDIIKGHLLDEGYADTEEAALKIMANMSEEWKRSIIEDAPLRDEPLWDMAGDKPKPPVKKPQPPVVKKPTPQAPMRDEPLW